MGNTPLHYDVVSDIVNENFLFVAFVVIVLTNYNLVTTDIKLVYILIFLAINFAVFFHSN